jgi:MSHA biogenesis protein MshJ
MKARLQSCCQWLDKRHLRERVVLFICALALLFFFADLFVLTPQADERKAAVKKMSVLRSDLSVLTAQEKTIPLRKDLDPDSENRDKAAQLQTEIKRKRDYLQTEVANLVTPSAMPELLRDLLTQEPRLQLLHLANQTPERLALSPSAPSMTEDVDMPSLFRHRLQLEFSGTYLATLDYLRKLEALPQTITWDSVEIETDEYPKATVRLQVHTLNLSEAWIGG